jgi:ABC-2 type transport system ATP-binding protein
MPEVALSLEGVSKAFDGRTVLHAVNLQVARASRHALLGPNGSGKTTLLRIMAGLVAPDAGHVRLAEGASGLGYVAQRFCLYEDLTVGENLRFQAGMRATGAATVTRSLGDFNLQTLVNRRTSTLSGGEHQRLMLACALLHEPALLLLDEPTAALDSAGRDNLWSLLDKLVARGATVVLTSHEVGDAARCDSVTTLAEGRAE